MMLALDQLGDAVTVSRECVLEGLTGVFQCDLRVVDRYCAGLQQRVGCMKRSSALWNERWSMRGRVAADALTICRPGASAVVPPARAAQGSYSVGFFSFGLGKNCTGCPTCTGTALGAR